MPNPARPCVPWGTRIGSLRPTFRRVIPVVTADAADWRQAFANSYNQPIIHPWPPLAPNIVTTPAPRPAVRAVVSLLVTLHVAAVFVGPWAMPPNSRLSVGRRERVSAVPGCAVAGQRLSLLRPRARPQPPDTVRSHARRRHAGRRQSSPTTPINGRGCLYHRYFMLSEFANTLESGPSKERAEAYARGYARHLAEQYHARSVKLYLQAPLRAPRRRSAKRASPDREDSVRGAAACHLRARLTLIASTTAAVRDWAGDLAAGWNRFWFEPTDPATLGLIRIFAGAMMFYTHLVWSLQLTDFVGPHSWLPPESVHLLQEGTYSWSYLWWIEDSPALLWTAHVAGLVVFAMLTVGLFTRAAAVAVGLRGAGLRIASAGRAVWPRPDQRDAGVVPGRGTVGRRVLRSIAGSSGARPAPCRPFAIRGRRTSPSG